MRVKLPRCQTSSLKKRSLLQTSGHRKHNGGWSPITFRNPQKASKGKMSRLSFSNFLWVFKTLWKANHCLRHVCVCCSETTTWHHVSASQLESHFLLGRQPTSPKKCILGNFLQPVTDNAIFSPEKRQGQRQLTNVQIKAIVAFLFPAEKVQGNLITSLNYLECWSWEGSVCKELVCLIRPGTSAP